GRSFFFALAVGVLVHLGARKLHFHHFPGEEQDAIRLPAPGQEGFLEYLFTLYLFSGAGAGVAWAAFPGHPLCHVLALAARALTYRLLFPLLGPGDVPEQGSRRNTSQGAGGGERPAWQRERCFRFTKRPRRRKTFPIASRRPSGTGRQGRP